MKKVSSSEKWYIGIVIGVGLLAILFLVFNAGSDTFSGEAYRVLNLPARSRYVQTQCVVAPTGLNSCPLGTLCGLNNNVVNRECVYPGRDTHGQPCLSDRECRPGLKCGPYGTWDYIIGGRGPLSSYPINVSACQAGEIRAREIKLPSRI